MTEPDFAVLRLAPGVPAHLVPDGYDGRWEDLFAMVKIRPGDPEAFFVAEPTGRFEFREDGACAEVYELRPNSPEAIRRCREAAE